MNGLVDQLMARLAREDAVLVRVESTQGSAPREAGTWMAVWAEGLTGTIGGGQLEFQATQVARELLAGRRAIQVPASRGADPWVDSTRTSTASSRARRASN